MENAVDAIYIAGAIFLLLLALTVGISSFSTQIAKIDQIVEADERIEYAQDESGNYINYLNIPDDFNGTRIVGVETIVNSLYRVFKENYIINIISQGYVKENTTIASDATKTRFKLTGAWYKSEFKISPEYNLNAKEKLNGILEDGLYDYLKERKFVEYIGELYQNDIGDSSLDKPEGVSDVNKTRTRIITYVEQN